MSNLNLNVTNEEKSALVIDTRDNVAVALTDLQKGDLCVLRIGEGFEQVTILEPIPFGHKIAIKAIPQNESVIKYGEEIGTATEAIQLGQWIHTHNLYCGRAKANGR
ncbi:UxaA family hydrolase [Paenibacillus cremeus]|uniref:Altronate dehydratase n=1 Tax=Paenibacillus cremeus TaxID=2163881 RepID=A0A559JDG3_9BACL|nr:UxaA family hydrolase [Paenibacillus cremeus]TVX97903.1 altronate dehydratase [Paenibacillus cremeus]